METFLTHGSLFAGIGGFDLGFERAGIETDWQIEIEDYCRRVLAQHFPGARQYSDIRNCCGIYKPNERRMRSGNTRHRCQRAHHLKWVDVISGGFPCQDISNAGKRAGIKGDRSGLWGEMLRIVRQLRPRYVVVENVSALLGRGMGQVLGDLAESGYDAEWDCLPAAAFSAPHLRDRVFLVAYPDGACEAQQADKVRPGRNAVITGGSLLADAAIFGKREQTNQADTQPGSREARPIFGGGSWWATEPDVGRVAHGIPARVDRLRGLGNAVVPQIAEWIAQRINKIGGA